MKTDFHYGVIKILARGAGFTEEDAETIAYASQYTDDAADHQPVNVEGIQKLGLDLRLLRWLEFLELDAKPERPLLLHSIEGDLFDPICTAHAGIDYLQGINPETQRKVYVSFHFLPASRWDRGPEYCYRTSAGGELARNLARACAGAHRKATFSEPGFRQVALCAMGIALHSFADTWAHDGFSGRWSEVDNNVTAVTVNGAQAKTDLLMKLGRLVQIGHIDASDHPDSADREVAFHFERNEVVARTNTNHFLVAAREVLDILASARNGVPVVPWTDLEDDLRACFAAKVGSDRRMNLLESTFRTRPGFDRLRLRYDGMSWERKALRMSPTPTHFGVRFRIAQANALWFDFHVAAAAQRAFVRENIKPMA